MEKRIERGSDQPARRETDPTPRQSLNHSNAQIGQIAASIEEFGFTSPIPVEPYGLISAGHPRLVRQEAEDDWAPGHSSWRT
jgi:hypothetical protein